MPCCTVTVLAQFFSYLTFDKRFSLVTATLIKAVHDIVPMLVILLSVLFTYSVLGSTIYGRELEEFSYVGQSLSTLMIVMLGDVDIYEDSKLN
jgi:Na+/alanine symporter